MYVRKKTMAVNPKLIYSASQYNSNFVFMPKSLLSFVNSFSAGVKAYLD